jgi:ketosteroid isomerase-like protein
MASVNIASELLQEWISAIESNDVDRITNLYRDDAFVIGFASQPDDRKDFSGYDEIHNLFTIITDIAKTKKIRILSQNPHVFGTIAINSGRYIEVSDQGREDHEAYFSFVYREDDDDGVWKIFSQHYSLVNFILNEFSVKDLREMLDKKEKENYSQDMR